ncbi:protein translocase subunit SecD [bacterium]|nr:protein translocase subunit SecD [bacterium]
MKISTRFIIIAIVLVACIALIHPSLRWASYDNAQRVALNGDPMSKNADEAIGQWKLNQPPADAPFGQKLAYDVKKWWQGDRAKVLNLGLDLQGGISVFLKVELDDAIQSQLESLRQRAAEYFEANNIKYSEIIVPKDKVGEIEFSFENAEDAKQGLDRLQGQEDFTSVLNLPSASGTKFTATMRQGEQENLRRRALDQARHVVENRVNELGLTEPQIQVEEPARIILQLPGEKDPNRVRDLLKKTAQLSFHVVADAKRTDSCIKTLSRLKKADKIDEKIFSSSGTTDRGVPYTTYRIKTTDYEYFKRLLEDPEVQRRIPRNCTLMLGKEDADRRQDGEKTRELTLVENAVAIDGSCVKDANVQTDARVNRIVALKLNSAGRNSLSKVSQVAERKYMSENKVTQLAICLDDLVYSSPLLLTHIDGDPIITGSFTLDECKDLALVLRSGSLPARLTEEYSQTVGASLGSDSIRKSIMAFVIGLAFVVVFMLGYYLLPGVVAIIALCFNVLITMSVLALFHATLTLPGIAGIILSIGMAVDANILIFERLREELASGKELKRAVKEAFGRAFITILDANLTTILVSIVLYIFGIGAVKGFAVTLIIGIAANLFTALFVSRSIFELLLLKVENASAFKMLQAFSNSQVRFVKGGKLMVFVALAIAVVGLTIFTIRFTGENKAIKEGKNPAGTSLLTAPLQDVDLTGGDMIVLNFPKEVKVDEVRNVLRSEGLGDSYIQKADTHQEGVGSQIIIRCTFGTSEKAAEALTKAMPDNAPETEQSMRIGPAVGKEMKVQTIKSVIIALILVLIYIWFRFKNVSFAFASIVALTHDVLITLAFFGFVTYPQMSLNVIAALLTIVAYSINNTIVVYDRIRENLPQVGKLSLNEVIDLSVNQVLSRTIWTSATTLFTILSLFLFGGDVIKDFAYALLVGMTAGTFSSIFLAPYLVSVWFKNKPRV